MTRTIRQPNGKLRLVTATAAKRDATEEAIDFHTDKVMMAAVKDDGMDLPTLKRMVTAVTPRNVIVALEHMKGTELSKLCKRVGLDGIPHSSNEGMRNAILTALDLETEPADGEEVFDHGLIFVAMKSKPTVFPGQRAGIKRAMMAYAKAKLKDQKTDEE